MDQLPLVTLTEAKAFLDVRDNVTKHDDRLLALIALATNDIEVATRRCFTEQAIVEHFTTRDNQRTDYDFRGSSDYNVSASVDLGGQRIVVQPQSFALKGVNVNLDTVRVWYNPSARSPSDFDDSNKLQDGVDYQVDTSDLGKERLFLYTPTRFRLRALKVEYTAGYAGSYEVETPGDEDIETLSAALPDFLRLAALVQVKFLDNKLRNDNIGMGTERTVGDRGKVNSAYFMKTNGLTSEIIPHLARFKRCSTGQG